MKVPNFGLMNLDQFDLDANLPDLKGFKDSELEELREFVKERHHQHEWEAFFRYVALPPWQRTLSRVSGVVVRALGF